MKKILLIVSLILLHSFTWAFGAAEKKSESTDIVSITEGRYINYSDSEWEKNSGKIRVLFFHASWCPSCRKTESDILLNYKFLPENTVIFKVDYDISADLKKKYGIASQHTFVITDERGEILTIRNGGDTLKIADEIEKL